MHTFGKNNIVIFNLWPSMTFNLEVVTVTQKHLSGAVFRNYWSYDANVAQMNNILPGPVHRPVLEILWLLTLEIWPWPWFLGHLRLCLKVTYCNPLLYGVVCRPSLTIYIIDFLSVTNRHRVMILDQSHAGMKGYQICSNEWPWPTFKVTGVKCVWIFKWLLLNNQQDQGHVIGPVAWWDEWEKKH